jgi:hypothetical protein
MSMKLTALASAGAAALAVSPAWAHDDAVPAPQKAPVVQAAQVKVVTAANSMTVVRDAQTGKLRAPTADEIESLLMNARTPAHAARSRTNTAPATFRSASGGAGLHLGEDAFAYSVARRNLDGSLTEVCVTGAQAAQKELAAPRLATSTSPLKELPNE